MKLSSIIAGGLLATGVATSAGAVSLLTDSLGHSSYSSFASGNTFFLDAMDANHSVTQIADFGSSASFSGADAVWVNAHIDGLDFTAAEAANVKAFIEAGHKGVIITDNSAWGAFNDAIEAIIGATITDTCDSSTGTGTSHPLALGVGSFDHHCGSNLDPAANAEVVVTEGIASLYSVGAGEVLVVTSVDWFSGSAPTQQTFINNISGYLNTPLSAAAVPVPATVPLLLSGFGALAFLRRRNRNAA